MVAEAEIGFSHLKWCTRALQIVKMHETLHILKKKKTSITFDVKQEP